MPVESEIHDEELSLVRAWRETPETRSVISNATVSFPSPLETGQSQAFEWQN